MELREKILKEHSKSQTEEIVRWVADDQEKFDELFSLLQQDHVLAQRASWPLSYCGQEHPSFISKHWKEIVGLLQNECQPQAVTRNLLRLLQVVSIPKKFQGSIMDICFQNLTAPKIPVAIRVFAMSILANLAQQHPGIKNELQMIIQTGLEDQSAAFKSRAAKVLKKLANL